MVSSMKEKFLKIFREKTLIIFIYLMIVLIAGSTITGFIYRDSVKNDLKIRRQIMEVNQCLAKMNQYVNLADLGLRGYMINQKETMLSPYDIAVKQYQENFRRMGQLLDSLGFDVRLMQPAESSIQDYMKLVTEMVTMTKNGDLAAAKEILDKDPGMDAWKIYSVFDQKASNFLNDFQQKNTASYKRISRLMTISQLVLFFLGLPILIVVIRILIKASRNRRELFARLEKSNDQYVFNDGKATDAGDEEKIIEQMIGNLKKVALRNRPGLRAVTLAVRRARLENRLARSSLYPQLSLVGRYEQAGDDLLARRNDYTNSQNALLMLEARWTLFEWGKTLHEMKEASHKASAMEEKAKSLMNKVFYEVEEAKNTLLAREKNLDTARAAISKAREDFRLTRLQFKEQLASTSDVLDARRYLTEAETNLLRARYGYLTALSMMERAVGMDLVHYGE